MIYRRCPGEGRIRLQNPQPARGNISWMPMAVHARGRADDINSRNIPQPIIILSIGIAHITLSMTDSLNVPLTYHVFCNAKKYRGADKSLARPRRKQATLSVRMAWISFVSLRCRKKTCWKLASPYCWNLALPWHASELVSFLVGLRTYQHPVITGTINEIRIVLFYIFKGIELYEESLCCQMKSENIIAWQ